MIEICFMLQKICYNYEVIPNELLRTVVKGYNNNSYMIININGSYKKYFLNNIITINKHIIVDCKLYYITTIDISMVQSQNTCTINSIKLNANLIAELVMGYQINKLTLIKNNQTWNLGIINNDYNCKIISKNMQEKIDIGKLQRLNLDNVNIKNIGNKKYILMRCGVYYLPLAVEIDSKTYMFWKNIDRLNCVYMQGTGKICYIINDTILIASEEKNVIDIYKQLYSDKILNVQVIDPMAINIDLPAFYVH